MSSRPAWSSQPPKQNNFKNTRIKCCIVTKYMDTQRIYFLAITLCGALNVPCRLRALDVWLRLVELFVSVWEAWPCWRRCGLTEGGVPLGFWGFKVMCHFKFTLSAPGLLFKTWALSFCFSCHACCLLPWETLVSLKPQAKINSLLP